MPGFSIDKEIIFFLSEQKKKHHALNFEKERIFRKSYLYNVCCGRREAKIMHIVGSSAFNQREGNVRFMIIKDE